MPNDWLPHPLWGRPFLAAEGRQQGVPAWRLRGEHLQRPTRSVRMAGAVEGPQQRASAFALALPDDVAFSHTTAAELWGLALPDELCGGPLHVMRTSDRTRIRRVGCEGHRGLERRSVARVRGLRLTGLADTWVDLGELPSGLLTHDDLVVLGDEVATRLIGPPEPGTGLPDPAAGLVALERALAARSRPRGRRLLSSALRQVRAPVRSPMETRARLMFVRAGFPEPAVNLPVLAGGGDWLLEGDLVWEEQRVIGEYQGRHHASIRQRSHDASRMALAVDEGWTVIEIFHDDVVRPPRRVACLRRFATALGLDPGRLHLH